MPTVLTPRNRKLFDELLAAAEKHRAEPGGEELLRHIESATVNYRLRSADYMIKSLVRALREAFRNPASPALKEIEAAVDRYCDDLDSGPSFYEMAKAYEESGGRMYTVEEILAEKASRR